MPTAHLNRILVVDDDKLLNGSLQRRFQQLGCETESCYDGDTALGLMEKEHFDGIVLDLMMPIKDGFAVLAKKSATLNSSTPAFVLTSVGQEKCELAQELGATMIFDKIDKSPSDVAELVSQRLTVH